MNQRELRRLEKEGTEFWEKTSDHDGEILRGEWRKDFHDLGANQNGNFWGWIL